MRVGINKEISRILERYKNVPGEYIFPLFPAERDPYAGYRSAYHRIRYSLGKISRVIGLEFPLKTSRGPPFMGHDSQGERCLGSCYW